MTTKATLATAWLVLVAACGGDRQEDADRFLAPPPIADPWDELATSFSADALTFVDAICARFIACDLLAKVGDLQACRGSLLGHSYGCHKGLEDVKLQGLTDCTAALTDVACSELLGGLPAPAACADVYAAMDRAAGFAADGEGCGSAAPCGTFSACTGSRYSCKVCVPLPAPGEACLTNAPSLVRTCAGMLVCADGKCAVPSLCGRGERGDPCDEPSYCSRDLVCSKDASKCVPVGELGGSCDDHGRYACRPPLYCDDQLCTDGDLAGAACQGDSDCDSQRCIGGHCSAAANGESCWNDASCASGACDLECVEDHSC